MLLSTGARCISLAMVVATGNRPVHKTGAKWGPSIIHRHTCDCAGVQASRPASRRITFLASGSARLAGCTKAARFWLRIGVVHVRLHAPCIMAASHDGIRMHQHLQAKSGALPHVRIGVPHELLLLGVRANQFKRCTCAASGARHHTVFRRNEMSHVACGGATYWNPAESTAMHSVCLMAVVPQARSPHRSNRWRPDGCSACQKPSCVAVKQVGNQLVLLYNCGSLLRSAVIRQ